MYAVMGSLLYDVIRKPSIDQNFVGSAFFQRPVRHRAGISWGLWGDPVLLLRAVRGRQTSKWHRKLVNVVYSVCRQRQV